MFFVSTESFSAGNQVDGMLQLNAELKPVTKKKEKITYFDFVGESVNAKKLYLFLIFGRYRGF